METEEKPDKINFIVYHTVFNFVTYLIVVAVSVLSSYNFNPSNSQLNVIIHVFTSGIFFVILGLGIISDIVIFFLKRRQNKYIGNVRAFSITWDILLVIFALGSIFATYQP
jgi:hypothetical protein